MDQYPQSIVCYKHPGRKAITRLNLFGMNEGENWSENVCKECEDYLMSLNPNMIDGRSTENYR